MKKFISSFFFLPLFLLLIILVSNSELFSIRQDIHIFWIIRFNDFAIVPVVVVFFSLYIIAIWLLLKFSNIFSGLEKKKLISEVEKLKAENEKLQGEKETDKKTELNENTIEKNS